LELSAEILCWASLSAGDPFWKIKTSKSWLMFMSETFWRKCANPMLLFGRYFSTPPPIPVSFAMPSEMDESEQSFCAH
jgi:hypothetical protein